jgi:hypothetical protein
MEPKDEKHTPAPADDDPYRDVGRRLFAAIMSAQLNLKSIDRTLKLYVPERLDRSWGELGWKLQRSMNSSAIERIRAEADRQNIHLVPADRVPRN